MTYDKCFFMFNALTKVLLNLSLYKLGNIYHDIDIIYYNY